MCIRQERVILPIGIILVCHIFFMGNPKVIIKRSEYKTGQDKTIQDQARKDKPKKSCQGSRQ